MQTADYANSQWSGQESVAFPDNWNVGLSFFHNIFAREHNIFVDAFRKQATVHPRRGFRLAKPSASRAPSSGTQMSQSNDLFEVARLVVAAEIAKIHTIEWTPQLLYNEPVYLAMNANWSGLVSKQPLVETALEQVLARLAASSSGKTTAWYSAFATGPGIFGLGNDKPDVNGGVNHFGSPFNFPEEFVTVYRLHPMVPDLIEFRELRNDPNVIRYKIPVVETLRGKATQRSIDTAWPIGLSRWDDSDSAN